MFKAVTKTDQTVTAGNAVPFELVFNTNDSTGYIEAGKGRIRKPGLYDFDALMTLTDVEVGNITATFVCDGVELTEVSVTATSGATTDRIIIPLKNVLHFIWSQIETPATVSVRLSTDATVLAGSLFTIKKIK